MSNTSTSELFSAAANVTALAKSQKRARPSPLSIRVSTEERALLKHEAAGGSIHGYARNKLFGAGGSPSRRVRRPISIDHAALGRSLGSLGQSRLASNMNQIAKAANIGALPVTPELTAELHAACADIQVMRRALIAALGIKP